MIIKDNLLKGYSGTQKIEPRNEGTDSDNYNYRQITIPATLEENQKYTFCFKFKQFNGSGEFSVMLYDESNTKRAGEAIFVVSDGKFYLNFIYRAGVTDNILIYSDVSGETRGAGAEIKDMIIVDGYHEETGGEIVYLPNKNDVKAENQAIFLSGGYSKRFIHSRYTGGGIC